MKSWKEVKDARIELKGYACEECGDTESGLIGHHVVPSKIVRQRGIYSVHLCRLRCWSCEVKMHKEFRNGNNPAAIINTKNFLLEISILKDKGREILFTIR